MSDGDKGFEKMYLERRLEKIGEGEASPIDKARFVQRPCRRKRKKSKCKWETNIPGDGCAESQGRTAL